MEVLGGARGLLMRVLVFIIALECSFPSTGIKSIHKIIYIFEKTLEIVSLKAMGKVF